MHFLIDFFSKLEWTWEKEDSLNMTLSIRLEDNNSVVIFHPVYSTGTAVVKGNKLLEKGQHHFWEILMLSKIHGTDVVSLFSSRWIYLESKAFLYV